MFRNYFLINLLLIIMLAVLGVKFYKVATHKVEMPSAISKTQKKKKLDVAKRTEVRINEADYDVISKLDLFRPSRSPAEKKVVRKGKGSAVDPPKLFGTVILNELKTAILEDPETRSTKTYRLNDSVAGYVLTEIFKDKVVLLKEGEKYEVKLRDDKGVVSPKRRVTSRNISRAKRKVSKPRRQSRPQNRRTVPPRSRRRVTPPPPHAEKLPEEVENFMEGLEELDR